MVIIGKALAVKVLTEMESILYTALMRQLETHCIGVFLVDLHTLQILGYWISSSFILENTIKLPKKAVFLKHITSRSA